MSDKKKGSIKTLKASKQQKTFGNVHDQKTKVDCGETHGFMENLPAMFYAVEPFPPYAPFYVSDAFESLGYPLEEWRNNPDLWLRLIHPDDCERVLAKTEAAMLAGKELDYEYRLVGKDGKIHFVRDRGCFIRDENGKEVCWQGIILDITEREKTLKALEESDARYRDIFENANDLIYTHDLQGNYVSINQAAERVFGYTREDVLKMNMKQVIAPEYLHLAQQMLSEKVAAGVKQTAYEVKCIAKCGNKVTLEVNSSIIYKDGEPISVQGIARDVTERTRTEEALRESGERYRDLFENANDLIYTHDLQGNFTSLNRTGERITGYSREEVVNGTINIAQVVAPKDLDKARKMIAHKIAGEVPVTYELEIITKQGQRVSLELSTRLILQNGTPIAVQGIARDISERKRTENSLHKTVSLLTSTLEASNDGIVVVNSEGEIVVYNEKFLEMWQIPPAVIEQKSGAAAIDFVKDQLKDPEKFLEDTAQLYEDPLKTALSSFGFKDGRTFERYSQPQYLEGNPVGRVCSFRDITERIRAEEQLLYYALHDTLTNLPNRAEFMNHLKASIDRTGKTSPFRFAVLFLDLDRFKLINDTLGHIVGDKLLIAIAGRLKSSVRQRDVVARLGGDEFTILLNHAGDYSDVVHVAERIQNSLSEPFKIDNYEIFTSASIGIVVSDEIHRDPEDYLRDADTAMYRAKETGKARYEVFDNAMHVRNMNLLRVENDLRKAIERREFKVFYQPIINLETGEICEFEALIRWQHPEFGLVAPNEFISVAEETGLIIPIGKWILEEACNQCRQWQTSFPSHRTLSISVNLSAKQLMHPLLTEQVCDALTKTGLKPQDLHLEVTESMVMEHSDTALNVLNELCALGVSLSTDDFGTGYSSLSYLHRFPFERLKIDRSFIGKMDSEQKSEEIVRTILTLAENLHLEVVAEGIETEAQFLRLRDFGCQLAQGYLFSKPVAASEAENILRDGLNYKVPFSISNRAFLIDDTVLEFSEVQ